MPKAFTNITEANGGDDVNSNEVASLPSSEEFKALVERANAADETALGDLRQLLDEHPEIWQRVGDAAKHAEMLLVGLIAGGDKLLNESLQRRLEDLKTQLGGSNPSPLERLAVERIICTWLQLQHVDAMVGRAIPGTKPATFLLMRQRQSDRAYTAAVKGLTTIRQLLPSSAGQFGLAALDEEMATSCTKKAILPLRNTNGRRRA